MDFLVARIGLCCDFLCYFNLQTSFVAVHLKTSTKASDKNHPASRQNIHSLSCFKFNLQVVNCQLSLNDMSGTFVSSSFPFPATKSTLFCEHPAVTVYVFEKSCCRRLHCTIVPPRSPPANQKVFLSISRSCSTLSRGMHIAA